MDTNGRKLKIAVLFDGGGLARLGLEQAGHDCTGYEIDPAKHYLSQMVGSGNSVLADVRDVDLTGYDAVWASPPCQSRSAQNHGKIRPEYAEYDDLLRWSLGLPHDVLWVENVLDTAAPRSAQVNAWGHYWNAAQFEEIPRQVRSRIIGGRYCPPRTYRAYQYSYPQMNICPAVLASESKQGGMARTPDKERRKATRWYGRPLSLSEMAYHQGFEIPVGLLRSWWYAPPFDNPQTGKPYTYVQWRVQLSQAIGNGVPVYMARAFGLAYSNPDYTAGMLPGLV